MKAETPLFPSLSYKAALSFGGSHLSSNPKKPRPISIRKAMHLVIKTELKHRDINFLFHEFDLKRYISQRAHKLHIRIYRIVIHHNHIHILLRSYHRHRHHNFLRTVGGYLGQFFSRQVKHHWSRLVNPRRKPSLFSGRPFSRIVSWGRDYEGTCRYLQLNELEKMGIPKHEGRVILAAQRSERFQT